MTSPEDDRLARVRERFDGADDYDEFMLRVLPGYTDILDLIADAVRRHDPAPKRAVDLGIGTGGVTERLLEAVPGLEVLGVDFSAEQLDRAAKRLARFVGRVTLQEADLRDFEVTGPVDAVVSCLAIHHLEDPDKRALFARLAELLPPGGLFVLADAVVLPPRLEERAAAARLEWYLQRNPLKRDALPGEVLETAHHDLDRPAPLCDQVRWLLDAGFSEAAPVWQLSAAAVIVGIR
jgi:tRNA (cmo5U34)-methyltransferase